MNAQKDEIKIKVQYNNQDTFLTVGKGEKIRQYLCAHFNMSEKEIVVIINDRICDFNETFDQLSLNYNVNQDLEFQMFDVKKLIENEKELQSLKNSTITNSPQQLQHTQVDTDNIDESAQYESNNNVEQEQLNNINQQDQKGHQKLSIINLPGNVSEIYQKTVKCIYCQSDIEKDIISTPCQHFYHPSCFDQYIYNTLQLSSTTLKCLCNCKLQLQILKLISEEKYQSYKDQLLKNQMYYFEREYHNKIGKCIDNGKCNFWFFIQTNSQIHQKIQCFQCSISNQKETDEIISSSDQKKIIVGLVEDLPQSNHPIDMQAVKINGNELDQQMEQQFLDEIGTKNREENDQFCQSYSMIQKRISQNKQNQNTDEMQS